MRANVRVTGACCLALFVAACDQSGTRVNYRHNVSGGGTKVATFGGDSVTAEELKARFEEMSPFSRPRYQTAEQRKEYVEEIIRFELLAAEAERRGLAAHPEVVDAAKKVMVQKLLQQELDEKPSPVTDADVAAYYEKHKANFVKDEMVRLSQVFLAAPAADPTAREAKRKLAAEIYEKAKAAPPLDYTAFVALVRAHSEDPRSKPLDGDLRYLSEAELERDLGPEITAASRKLMAVGDVTPVIETAAGFHILKLQGRQAALNLAMAEVKPQILKNLINERRTARFKGFLEELNKKADVKYDLPALGRIEVDMKAPSKTPTRPPPGMVPPPGGR